MTLIAPIETPSLLLRPFEEKDFDAYAALVGDDVVTRYLTWGPRRGEAAREAFERRKAPAETTVSLAAVDRASGRFAGDIGLFNIGGEHRGAELGYILHPDFHRRGLAAEAAGALLRVGFAQLRLHRIFARCDDRNRASARVMEKIGMRHEGHFLSDTFAKDEWSGTLYYAILEEEWRARQGG